MLVRTRRWIRTERSSPAVQRPAVFSFFFPESWADAARFTEVAHDGRPVSGGARCGIKFKAQVDVFEVDLIDDEIFVEVAGEGSEDINLVARKGSGQDRVRGVADLDLVDVDFSPAEAEAVDVDGDLHFFGEVVGDDIGDPRPENEADDHGGQNKHRDKSCERPHKFLHSISRMG